jgi:hypothetical protein
MDLSKEPEFKHDENNFLSDFTYFAGGRTLNYMSPFFQEIEVNNN